MPTLYILLGRDGGFDRAERRVGSGPSSGGYGSAQNGGNVQGGLSDFSDQTLLHYLSGIAISHLRMHFLLCSSL